MRSARLLCQVFLVLLVTGCVTELPPTSAPGLVDMPGETALFMASTSSPSPSMFPSPTPESPQPVGVLQPLWGLVMEQITPGEGLDQVAQAGTYWLRSHRAVSWAFVEPVEGERNWSALSGLEEELRTISDAGMNTILSVRVTPAWAQQIAGYSCGPIKPEKLESFAYFMRDLVLRYTAAPYNIKYWEIWNEPDIDHSSVPPDSPYGCWGNASDPYFGGGYYAEMLKVVYPQIKAADSQAQVLIGGLALDCDPRPGAGCAVVGHNEHPPKFLEGILQNNGSSYFDGVSFHAYDYYYLEEGQYGNPNWLSAWNTTGPVSSSKIEYLQTLLSQYGASDKYLVNSETALLCGRTGTDSYCQTDDFANTKAYYLSTSFVTALAEGLYASIWYNLLGWRGSGLLNPSDLTPLPVFDAYRFSVTELGSARFLKRLQQYPGVSGYEFEREGGRIWVMWSVDGDTHPVDLPSAPSAVYDVYGSSLAISEGIQITLSPIYIEWK